MTFRLLRALAAALLACFAAVAFAAVDVNSATASDLDAIKGIGPAIAGRIVAERAKGPYKDWQDLVTRVKGVGPKTAAEFSTGGLTVNGAAFAGAPAATTATTTTPRTKAAPRAPTVASTSPVVATPTTMPPATPASAPLSAADRKAAAKAARDEKKAAKAAAVAQARQDRMAKPSDAASAASGAMR